MATKRIHLTPGAAFEVAETRRQASRLCRHTRRSRQDTVSDGARISGKPPNNVSTAARWLMGLLKA